MQLLCEHFESLTNFVISIIYLSHTLIKFNLSHTNDIYINFASILQVGLFLSLKPRIYLYFCNIKNIFIKKIAECAILRFM